jgi:hypothetical protein
VGTPNIRGCAITSLPKISSATTSTPIGSVGYSEVKLSKWQGIYLNIYLQLRASHASHATWVVVDPRLTETWGSRLTKRINMWWPQNGFYHCHRNYTSSTSTTSGHEPSDYIYYVRCWYSIKF